jgi:hypothetical protein
MCIHLAWSVKACSPEELVKACMDESVDACSLARSVEVLATRGGEVWLA